MTEQPNCVKKARSTSCNWNARLKMSNQNRVISLVLGMVHENGKCFANVIMDEFWLK